MTYKPFSIVAVPFPFTDKAHTKRRPALVLSSLAHQEQTQHITLVMITSAENSTWPSDYRISTLAGTGLSVASIIRQKLFTIDARLVLKEIGELSAADTQETLTRLKANLANL